MNIRNLYILLLPALLAASCDNRRQAETTPWGTTIGEDSISMAADDGFSLSDIQANGELIVLTLTGPDSYYEYHGRGMGTQYLLAEKFAQRLGVSLRVDVCSDTADMVRRLESGDGDIVAYMMPKPKADLAMAGARDKNTGKGWLVKTANEELAKALDEWYKPGMAEQAQKDEAFLLSARSVRRKVYSPMLNRAGGVISRYDRYFQQYAPLARWDWRLIAAQCYQESTFDPQARSWAGAMGLMQIMPSTATLVGLAHADLLDPEKNIAAACRYIAQLMGRFADVRDRRERISFVLASYNGGFYHIRDAMALAHKYGKDQYRWADVREYVLGLQQPRYYADPVVKHGYMRGSETAQYVDRINQRYAEYRGVAHAASGFVPFGGGSQTPHRATKRKSKYEVK